MDRRWILFFLVFTAAYFMLLVPTFQKPREEPQATPTGDVVAQTDVPTTTTVIAAAPRPEGSPPVAEPVPRVTVERAERTLVETPFQRVVISHRGAVPISWQLPPSEYLAPVRGLNGTTTTTVELIPQVRDVSGREFPLQLEGRTAYDFNEVPFEKTRDEVTEEGRELEFLSAVVDGVQVRRTYHFRNDSYVTDLAVEIVNGEMRTILGQEGVGWGIGWQGGFTQPVPGSRYAGQVRAGGAVAGELRMRQQKPDEAPLRYDNRIGWVAQEKKYFVAALVPAPENPPAALEVAVRRRNITDEYRQKGVDPPMSAVLYHPAEQLAPGEVRTLRYSLVVAPKDFGMMTELDTQLPMVAGTLPLSAMAFDNIPLGQGWLRPISLWLLKMLRWFASHVNNWGWAIILLVLVVKIVLYPLSHWAIKAQAKAMAEQQRIRPHLEKINQKYKDDPSKRSQEMMKLYREHNINPLGMLRGCFPILLQMPIFFALYVLLDQAVELRGQEFLWIADLTQPDRVLPFGFTIPLLGWDALNILPILMAVTQYFTSKLMMMNIQDKMQRQMMIMMPVFFLFILYGMPSGLMLYWTVQNIWQIGHTVLTKRYVATHDSSSGGSATATAAA